MVLIRRQQEILRKVDLDAMAFADCDRRRNLEELIEAVDADCETLADAPVANACEPFVEMIPPPSSISPAPAITPSAIEVPKIWK